VGTATINSLKIKTRSSAIAERPARRSYQVLCYCYTDRVSAWWALTAQILGRRGRQPQSVYGPLYRGMM